MSELPKVGDRVRCTQVRGGFPVIEVGEWGTVTALDPGDLLDIGVQWDCVDYAIWWMTDRIETAEEEQKGETEDVVSAPNHYRSHPSGIEPIQITKHMGFLDGNVIKYVMRAPYKGAELQDLKKARQYLDWLIEEKSE